MMVFKFQKRFFLISSLFKERIKAKWIIICFISMQLILFGIHLKAEQININQNQTTNLDQKEFGLKKELLLKKDYLIAQNQIEIEGDRLLNKNYYYLNKSESSIEVLLTSSAYGALFGALLGLGTLVMIEDPQSKVNVLARGTSLGLYTGLGFGIFSWYKSSPNPKLSF